MKKLIPYVIYLVTLLPIVFFRNHLYSMVWVSILSLISIYKYFNAIGMKKTIYEYFSYLLLGVAVGMYTQMNIFEEIIIIFLLIISILINLIMKKKYTFNQILLSVFGYLYTIMLPLYLLMIAYRVKMFYSFILLFIIILLIKLTEYLKK